MKLEWPGILAWAVRGCLAWQKDGLGECPVVEAATKEYRAENDTLQAFIEEVCHTGEHDRIWFGELYKAYSEWATESGEHFVWNKSAFGKKLREKGFKTVKSNGESSWLGIDTKRMPTANGGVRKGSFTKRFSV